MRKRFAFAVGFALAVLFAAQLAAQTVVTQIQAERMLLLAFADPNNGIAAVNGIGFQYPVDGATPPDNDADIVAAQAAAFYSTYTSLITTYNSALDSGGSPSSSDLMAARDSAVATAFSNINAGISGTDQSILGAYLAAAETNMAALSVTVYSHQFYETGVYGDDSQDGWDDESFIDGISGGGPNCVVTAQTGSQFDGGGQWFDLSGAATQLSAAFDGTVVVRNSASQLFWYNSGYSSWTSLSGAELEIAAGSAKLIYTIGTNNQLDSYNLSNNTWTAVSGAPTNLQHLAVGTDGSIVVSSGTTVYFYAPSLGVWKNLGATTASVNSVAIRYALINQAEGQVQWSVDVVDAAGNAYSGGWENYTYYFTKGSWPTLPGTLEEMRDGGDGSRVARTSSGVYQRTPYLGTWTLVTSAAYSSVGTDSANSIYVINSSGGMARQFPSNATQSETVSIGNHYVTISNYGALNNVPYGVNSFDGIDWGTAWQVCGSVKTVFFDLVYTNKVEMAYSKVKMASLVNTYSCGMWWSEECGNWAVSSWCTNVPDLNPAYMEGALNPTPWGWSVFGICESATGHAPWTCELPTALVRYPQADPQPKAACTSNP